MTPEQMLRDLHHRFGWVMLRKEKEPGLYGIYLAHTYALGWSAAEAIRNLWPRTRNLV